MPTNANDPAFPGFTVGPVALGATVGSTGGMTKREQIATELMAGLLSRGYTSLPDKPAQVAVTFTDALIAELNK